MRGSSCECLNRRTPAEVAGLLRDGVSPEDDKIVFLAEPNSHVLIGRLQCAQKVIISANLDAVPQFYGLRLPGLPGHSSWQRTQMNFHVEKRTSKRVSFTPSCPLDATLQSWSVIRLVGQNPG
jgi:hypothetical protein